VHTSERADPDGKAPTLDVVVASIRRRAEVTASSILLCGCERAPSINVLGAFFPSWMLCAVAGIGLALVVRWVFIAAGVDASIGPRGVVYPALALAFSLATWVAFFRG
jgi:YtcA family